MVFLNNITMRHFYLTFLILLVCNILQAQEEVFMYNGNNKEFFEVNDSVKYIKSYGGEIVLPNAKRGLYYVVVTLKDKTITNKMVIQ